MAKQDQMNIYQKLAEVRKKVEVIKKNKAGFGYKYVTEDEILAKITVSMNKYNLSLIPSITRGTTSVAPYSYKKTKTTKSGETYEENVNEILVNADMTYTWVNNDNPDERVEVEWSMIGHQSDGSQSFGSGLTYSTRYFLLKYFNIATTDDDPDNFRSKQREAEAEEDKIVAEGIIQNVDAYVQGYLVEHPDKRDDLGKLVTKYVKSGNYFAIKESTLAVKLLQDVRTKFPIKEEK